MRLIDEDKLIHEIETDREKILAKYYEEDCDPFYGGTLSALQTMVNDIEKQPTAYDVDKVVEQLEELKSLVPVNRILDDIVNEKPKELGMLIAYSKAIEIVKGGGVDGN